MRLAVIAIVVSIALAALVASGAGETFGLSTEQTGRAIPLVALLGVLVAGLLARRRGAGELLRGLGLWTAIFAVVLVGYTYRDDLRDIGARVFGELLPGQPVVDRERGSVTFRRGQDGHFEVTATIDGTSLPLIFDTGASAVVLTARDARRVGIDTTALSYTIPVSTANGTGRAASVVIGEIDVGGIVRRNVRAYIAEDGALDTSLLGMSFLETLHSYSVTRNGLELIG